jgi:hypothetical protein
MVQEITLTALHSLQLRNHTWYLLQSPTVTSIASHQRYAFSANVSISITHTIPRLTQITKPMRANFEFRLIQCGISVRRSFDKTELGSVGGVGRVDVDREGD